ncbi:hypothetical protein [Kluyvera ascorbata]|uniref:hypothetical protein n=2 Tax=Kluyvera ascorbata TaxID=51288 RepID=UPI000E083DB1|nr:hypothetical protein [Kluyvera ascorbata]STW98034.1 Uncharacterised protein [Kluyvera ascorbata]HBL0735496.1 hypothetical protein [Kluyvera ascorbata]
MKISIQTGLCTGLLILGSASFSVQALTAGQWEISGKSCRTLSNDGRTIVATGTDNTFLMMSLNEDCRQYRWQDQNRVISLLIDGQAMTGKAVCHDQSGRWLMMPDNKAGMSQALALLQQNAQFHLSTSDREVNTTVQRGNYTQICPEARNAGSPATVPRTEPGDPITNKNRMSLDDLMKMNQ